MSERPPNRQQQALSTDRRKVARALGLEEAFDGWLHELEQIDPSYPALAPLEANAVAGFLSAAGCSAVAVEDALATLPSPEAAPELWWLLERSHARIVATMGDPHAGVGVWPIQLPEHLGPAVRCFPLHLSAAVAPHLLDWHRAHDTPEPELHATLADIGRHAAIQRQITGDTGIDAPWWLILHLRALLLEIGGLQYELYVIDSGHPAPWYDRSEAARRGSGFLPRDLALALHIPQGAELGAEALDASLQRARAIYERVHQRPAPRLVTCSSWLMDDALASYLPPDSRIVSFQRSFELVPGGREADSSVLQFVFRKRGLEVSRAAATSRLQHAVLDHLEQGKHFRWCTGWLELPGR